MILIIGHEEDAHLPYVTRKLDARGAPYLVFNSERFPSCSELSIAYRKRSARKRTLFLGGPEWDLQKVAAAWDRRGVAPRAADSVAEENRWWASEVSTHWLSDIWESLDCFWIPHRPFSARDPYRKFNPDIVPPKTLGPRFLLSQPSPYSKLHQLAVADRIGMQIPRTLMTNSPRKFLAFYEQCRGHVISKTVMAVRVFRDGERRLAYTHAVSRRDMARYRSLRYAPVILQEYVPKRLELRITVVGGQVFPAEIHSQENRYSKDDWRREPEFSRTTTRYARHELPPKIRTLCVRLVKTLGLSFGAIDMVLTPNGEYVFLEVNPNGQWAWIEDLTGLPISQAIADLLTGRHP